MDKTILYTFINMFSSANFHAIETDELKVLDDTYISGNAEITQNLNVFGNVIISGSLSANQISSGGEAYTYVETSTYTVKPNDSFIAVMSTLTGPCTLTMLSAEEALRGKVCVVFDKARAANHVNTITIVRDPETTDLIQGNTSIGIRSPGGSISLVSDGSNQWTLY